jgi:filamentous hemagglutinin family protein
MNRVHPTPWNIHPVALPAVDRARASHDAMPSGRRRAAARAAAAAFALTAIAAAAQQVLPTGGTVTAGQASIQSQGNALTVNQQSQRAAINWQSFSIGNGASVTFRQPDAGSVTLNRVVGNERSVIDGVLQANGQVWLLNANGVLFNRGAQVNAAGLVASTLDISDADFMAGRSTFSANGSRASVINLGTLQAADAGHVALLGNQVVNEGVISARLGSAVLAAGDRVSLNFNGSSLVGVTVDRGTLDALVHNKQAILADGGLVVLTARGLDNVLAGSVNNSGEVRAQTVAEQAGRIFLLGGMDGDTVHVGGRIDASAPHGGAGGQVETSAAHVVVAPDALVTTRAAQGAHGTWRIDPQDFVVGAAGDITGAALGAALANGNVTIETATGGVACTGVTGCGTGVAGNGDIRVQQDIVKAAGADATLTLKAHNAITVDDAVAIRSTAGKLNVLLSANNGGGNTGSITLGQGTSIDSHGGDVVLGGALTAGRPANDHLVDIALLDGATITAGAGSIALYGKSVSAGNYTALTGSTITADTESLSMSYAEGAQWTATNAMTLSATGSIELSGSYQPPAGSSYLTAASQTVLAAGNSLALDAGDSLRLYGLSLSMTGTGANSMTLKAGSNLESYDSSVRFSGTPDLKILVRQSDTQASVANIAPAQSTVAGYLAATGTTAWDLAMETGSGVDSSHFGLHGAPYRVQVYADGPLLQVSPKTFDNGAIAIGTGLSDSVNEVGNLRQPFYYDPGLARWAKLTYSSYDMDLAVGAGGTGTAGWNDSGTILSTSGGTTPLSAALTGLTVDTAGLARGTGVINVAYTLVGPDNGEQLRMVHEYSLGAGNQFIRTVTRTTNTGSAAADNVRMWVGTRDDYVAITDSNVKTKGNLTASGFVPIASATEQARSIVISEFDPSTAGTPGSAVLFHSTNVDADTVTDSCCDLGNVIHKDPRASAVVTPNQDGSYGIFMNYGAMGAGDVRQVTWYYGAAPLASIGSVVNQVVAAGGAQVALPTAVTPPAGAPVPPPAAAAEPPAPAPVPVVVAAPAPAPAPELPTAVLQNVVAQALAPQVPVVVPAAVNQATGGPAPVGTVASLTPGIALPAGTASDLLLTPASDAAVPDTPVSLAQARQLLAGGESAATPAASGSNATGTGNETGGVDTEVRVPAGRNSRVQIVNGGVRLPSGVEQQLFVILK